ncbi:hypothetical protein ABIE45_006353 [Methylobacterium sp. OAE515]|uniref:hypothetical protein n=1 Tax=Methylobacterium sp. OAE515 TaxID=2817895 RepID=UPI00178AA53E
MSPGSSHGDRLIGQRPQHVHIIRAKDSTSRLAIYFFYVEPQRERAFLDALKGGVTLELEDHGRVPACCYGEKATQEVKDLLLE